MECILCYEQPVLIGLLPCNHRYICHICAIKLCANNLCHCPICKVSSGVLLFSSNLEGDYDTITKGKVLKENVENGMTYMYAD